MKKRVIIIISLLLILLGIYFGGYVYFNNHFLANSYVNNKDVSLDDLSSANEKFKDEIPIIIVKQKDKSEEIRLTDLDQSIKYDMSDLINKQNKILWFISFFNKREYACNKISGEYKEDNLNRIVDNLYCLKEENIKMPVDAHLSIDNGSIQIIKEDDGAYIKKDVVYDSLKEKIDEYYEGLDDNVLDLTDKYAIANIKEDDNELINKKKEYDKYLEKTITININNSNSEYLSGNSLANLYKIENNELKYDDDKVNNYISSITYYYNVSSYNYIDRSSFKNDLVKSLDSINNSTINLNWIEETKRFIEVIISEQTLYYYENDTLILSSPVVTGNAEITGPTPTGYFSVTRKVTDTNLVGADYTEHVDYWIGFDETGRIFGFHDASWRDEFGGEIYLSDPSRGCVNMPVSKISILFDYVTIGTSVYIH